MSVRVKREIGKPRGRPRKDIRYIYVNNNMDYMRRVDELKLDGNISEN